MTPKLPISLCLFSSTKGHFGHSTYQATLTQWDRQVPLATFGQLICHLKVTPGDETIAEQMVTDLTARGFHVLQTTAAWERGLSHGSQYLGDQIKVSKDTRVYTQPYMLLLEDDTPLVTSSVSLEDILLRSCQLLADNHELVSVRTIRRGDYDGGVPSLGDAENGRAFYSPHTDYQTPILRSLDFYRLCLLLEANPKACETVQCEQLWAIILSAFSRAEKQHLVWKPDWVNAIHLGVPDYPALKASLNL